MVGIPAFTKYGKLDCKDDTSATLRLELNPDENQETSHLTQTEAERSSDAYHTYCQNRPRYLRNASGERKRSNCCRRVYHFTIFLLILLASLAITCTIRQMLGIWLARSSSLVRTSVFVFDGSRKFITWPDPPPHTELAAVARYVMHISEWGSLSTNSTHKGIEGYPFVNVFSVSDGPVWNSTGIPYFYFTPLELSVKDIEVDNRVSFTVSEAQSDYCHRHDFDPEDPRCAHIIFTGTLEKVPKGSEEEKFAKFALFSRHSEMKDWPDDHSWFFARLNIIHIYVLDYFGGAGIVSPEDYFVSNPFSDISLESFID